MSPDPKPLIGITSGLTRNRAGSPVCQLGQAYTNAVETAGGIPVIIPTGIEPEALTALFHRLEGVLLSGGGDIDPQRFNRQTHPLVSNISPQRDALEFALLEWTLDADKPLLAICRGIQMLNVALGGSLHTHIPDQVEHALKHDWYPDYPRDKLTHTVSLTCGSQLDHIYGDDEIRVNSLHHQSISRVGQGLKATGFSPDGLVEGVEVEGASFGIGVQWHPECLPGDQGSQALFRAFIDASRRASGIRDQV